MFDNNRKQKEDHFLHFMINDKSYDWNSQYITEAELRKLGDIPIEDEIFLAIKKPWEDEILNQNSQVDLARPGIEHFYSHKHGEQKMVIIRVNDIERKISRGKHTVEEIKKAGEVPSVHELEELIDGKLMPLDDNAVVHIKGNEAFYSHVRDGHSS